MEQSKVCVCYKGKCIVNISKKCKEENSGRIHRMVILEEFSCTDPKPGDPVKHKGSEYELLMINKDGSAWLKNGGDTSFKAPPCTWQVIKNPVSGDLVMVSRGDGKFYPRLFHQFNYNREGAFTIEDKSFWPVWRFPNKEDLEKIYAG